MIGVIFSRLAARSAGSLLFFALFAIAPSIPAAAEMPILEGNLEPIDGELPRSPHPPSLELGTPPASDLPIPELDSSVEESLDATPTDLEMTYTLGAGDRIHLGIFNVPEYTGEHQVLVDGSINLPLVGNVFIENLTLNQAADAIATAYNRFLRTPIVTVSLLAPRPLRIGVSGEVHRPGSYAMSLTAGEADSRSEPQWPTITQAIQLAGGITQLANIHQVQVSRPQRLGENQVITVDLWALLVQGDLSQDLTLRDGDTILIPTGTSIDPAEATQLATASFSPSMIRVNVVGEVIRPGTVEVPPNTPLNQALLAAGGFDTRRARTRSVELVRLNSDGTVSRTTVPVDLAQGASDPSNPVLRQNDVIVVGRSGSASFSDALDGVFGTLGRIFPLFRLF